MSSTTAREILDNITAKCLDVPPDVFPIAVAPAGILHRYDAACMAVANARTVDEVQEIASRAEALRAYARQARNRQLEIDAAEIRIRADRRVGELMSGQAHTVGKAKGHRFAGGLTTNPPADGPPTLAEAGIDKNQAHRSRSLAAMPKEKFEELLDEKRHRHDRRVALVPEVETKADTAARDGASGECTPEALAAENEKLSRLVATLRREVKLWRERAEAAGWKETADA
jgi:hypothetical protein